MFFYCRYFTIQGSKSDKRKAVITFLLHPNIRTSFDSILSFITRHEAIKNEKVDMRDCIFLKPHYKH